MPKNKVKLLLNLLLIATHAVPRGGTIHVTVVGAAAAPTFSIACTGQNSRIPPNVQDQLQGNLGDTMPDAHMVQPIYAGLLAKAAGMSVHITKDGDTVEFKAEPIAIVVV
jgi:histidine phosphotransferase ChpT